MIFLILLKASDRSAGQHLSLAQLLLQLRHVAVCQLLNSRQVVFGRNGATVELLACAVQMTK